jgi:hypothetical protein
MWCIGKSDRLDIIVGMGTLWTRRIRRAELGGSVVLLREDKAGRQGIESNPVVSSVPTGNKGAGEESAKFAEAYR